MQSAKVFRYGNIYISLRSAQTILLHAAAHPDALRNIASAACASAHSPGDTSARRAGVGATGIFYACPGTATGRFSQTKQEL